MGLLIVMELGLRSLFGFGNPLIYIPDQQIGYLLAPNQGTRRFGNRIEINQYSMRSGAFQEVPTSLRVLVLGDSIANGGWWTDQANTIPSLIMNSFQEVEVLNASANSWSPRNQLAYLEKFGTFNAGVVVLLINTDDLFGTAPTSLPVGRDRNYPDHKPLLAIFEVCQRYIFKQKAIPGLPEEKGDRVGTILTAIDKIYNISQEKNSKFLLVMTPLLRELDQPGSRDYEIVARQRLSDFTRIKGINYVDFLPIFQATTNPETLYHDHIHLNLQGSQLVSQEIGRSLLLETPKSTQ
ncbi:SGNH/GDSL hydrolase family protein [Cronbergia sp. UHCC 0137]|uniref:SGNH/GDSL hydrolase family protein n=1 Tax=Cronbergia sp. UHCC 0137 TaxID=3110239 RepID=UPI002B211A32|nr:SGNH/GDSL hydrolase family protein [Cronbergia sp. UHCC 0137]MEA5616984.1 SGNH/GDSL hydrolase family protein [Cronbergia sp. UHCC 0137]